MIEKRVTFNFLWNEYVNEENGVAMGFMISLKFHQRCLQNNFFLNFSKDSKLNLHPPGDYRNIKTRVGPSLS